MCVCVCVCGYVRVCAFHRLEPFASSLCLQVPSGAMRCNPLNVLSAVVAVGAVVWIILYSARDVPRDPRDQEDEEDAHAEFYGARPK